MNHIIKNLLLPACMLLAACGSDDGYNADTAESPYNPLPADTYRMVKSVKFSVTNNNRSYSYDYAFRYDAQNRIKAVDGTVATYVIRNNRYYELDITSVADYYYVNGDGLKVVYNAQLEFPTYTDWNTTRGETYYGTFNANGALQNFATFDCSYSGALLDKAYVDNARSYTLYRDRYNNVTGYSCDSLDVEIASNPMIYSYSDLPNRTNLDFSALIGNWVIEREIYGNENWLMPMCMLAAFDMLGGRGSHLPAGEWTLDEHGCPVGCVLPSGITLNVEYDD